MSDEISPKEAWEKIKDGALVLDVRTIAEFSAGHLGTALHIPYDQLESQISKVGDDKSRTIITYCKSGHRSGIAAAILKKHGFSNVFNAMGYEDLVGARTPG